MSSYSNDQQSCSMKMWIAAGLTGLLVFILKLTLGSSLISSIFVGLLVAVLLGLLLVWLFCNAQEQPSTSAAAPAAVAAGATGSAAAAKAAAAKAAADEAAAKAAADEAAAKAAADEAAAKAAADEAAAKAAADEAAAKAAADEAAAKAAAKVSAAPATDLGAGTRPEALSGPRGGTADDLKKIKGVGPKMEELLFSLGFYHFDQVAGWTASEVAWVDQNLKGFKGRVSRDNWVDQAKLLAAGGDTEFSKKVDKGGVY